MKPFEVTVAMPPTEPALHMLLDANHWMDAWKIAMGELGIADIDESEVTCTIREDGAVEVTMPDATGRRFLVASAPSPDLTTSDRPAVKGRSAGPCITIEEMPSVRPDAPLPAAPPITPAPATPAHDRVYPQVYALDGGEATNLREAVSMLAGHVAGEHVLFIVPSRDRTSWQVALWAHSRSAPLGRTHIASTAPVPGPVDSAAGRRRFADTVSLVFVNNERGARIIDVRSALWAPVHVDQRLRGIFLVLNAPAPAGFDSGEFEAIRQVASLVAERLKTS